MKIDRLDHLVLTVTDIDVTVAFYTLIEISNYPARDQSEFLTRGIASRDDAARTGVYHSTADVHKDITERLEHLRTDQDTP
jgi:hypothetical protein